MLKVKPTAQLPPHIGVAVKESILFMKFYGYHGSGFCTVSVIRDILALESLILSILLWYTNRQTVRRAISDEKWLSKTIDMSVVGAYDCAGYFYIWNTAVLFCCRNSKDGSIFTSKFYTKNLTASIEIAHFGNRYLKDSKIESIEQVQYHLFKYRLRNYICVIYKKKEQRVI